MKRISLFAALFAFAALFSVSASAQGATQPGAMPKIAVINTAAFDGKEGLTRYNVAMDSLPVSLQIASGGGTITPQTVITTATGEASVKWTMGAAGANSARDLALRPLLALSPASDS